MQPEDMITTEKVVALTRTLVEIPSETGKEKAIGDWLVKYFQELGLTGITRLPVKEAGDTIVAVLERKKDGPTMMLNFHIDTFDAFEGWDTEPFRVVETEDRIIGLGAHDMKGGAACALAALEAIVKSGTKLGGNLIISGTSDEEYWSRGTHELINSGIIKDCDYCIVPEPAAHATILIGERGRHVFTIRFYGKSISAAYDEGINAVVDASKVIAEFEKHKPDGFGYLPEYDMKGTLCVIGLHSGGDKIYVPELAEVTVDRHILPGQTVEEAAQQIRDIIDEVGIKGTYELTWDERPTPAPASFITDPESRFVQAAKRNLEEQLGEEVKFALAMSVADTNHIAVHGGVPTIIMGPTGGNTCQANEWVDKASLPQVSKAILGTVLDLLGIE
ncbi:M20/M25/M40 family metallo-hydrolase [Candidatus Bathyarchaeota archaeon]|jgi:succinyl-diaminopimelate desuccinylase|nr:M20/M25/M40 family metallo-hydrolase [Candidatus Bathyarchaeota archaeon]MBT4424865.1 M20/M25/M40 family metallo-hydrolase [Candidatus Bathyarchaeota archaeon]MBT6604452.1 M20/M25/M40 family metallo-hydrolase [Candidatus Bathyarchaeota archaeon]MBT7186587.1 M20/M25/M40 family metallo-hydrolase [Candidatus Bathyarchaeota archaeon]MBT7347041.1 M20/M25/M40 family metallo-hydrolase [Candidatus Bathyarchaeota archaeon]